MIIILGVKEYFTRSENNKNPNPILVHKSLEDAHGSQYFPKKVATLCHFDDLMIWSVKNPNEEFIIRSKVHKIIVIQLVQMITKP